MAIQMMMKKRIFIAMHYMELGGAEISLIGLLQALDYSKYDVDLFIYSHQGELMQFIPKEVNLLPEVSVYAYIERPVKEALLAGHIRLVLARLRAKWAFRHYLKKNAVQNSSAIFQYVSNAVTPILPSLYKYGEYDLAISFLTPHNIVLEKVKAKKKACWIHTDYSTIDVNAELELPIWSGYNHIVAISDEARKAFLKVFPSLENKILVMENILSSLFVRQRAEEFDASKEMAGGKIKLLSVGRFCEAKNYDNVPDICKKINSQLSIVRSAMPLGTSKNSQLTVRWYLIGFGGYETLIREKIKEAGMEEQVIILGKKTNPYPYMKACDIYVQPSRYEGKSVTVREAQMLYKPVVVTDYPTAKSQIKNEVDGVIVPMDNESCAKGMADFILNTDLQSSIVDYLYQHDYGNVKEIEKLKKIIDE